MKRILILLALIIVGVTSAQAQTKEFLELFNSVKSNVERSILYNSSSYSGVEVAQYPADMLRVMGVKELPNSRNILGNLKMIYQIKISFQPKDKGYANSVYRNFSSLTYSKRKPKLYEQCMCQTSNKKEFRVYKAIKKRGQSLNEYMIFIRDDNKGMICDIVGYMGVESIMTMLSPELKNYVKEDTLNISNK